MSKLLVFNDPHIADNPPAGRKDDYMESLLAKLDEIVTLANNHRVDALVCTGDLFHVKNPAHVSHNLVSRIMEILDDLTPEFYIVPGNHDLTSAGLASLSKQPLRSLEAAGRLRILTYPITIDDEVTLLPVPWNHQRETDPEYYAVTSDKGRGVNKRRLMIAHGPLLAPGDVRPYPYLNVDDIPNHGAVNVVFSGHIHERLGLTELNCGTQFCNFGSVSRLSRTQANMLRKVSVALYDSGSNEVTELALEKVKSISEVFHDKAPGKEAHLNKDSIARLADTLSSGLQVQQLSIRELVASVADDDISDEARHLVIELLEEAENND